MDLKRLATVLSVADLSLSLKDRTAHPGIASQCLFLKHIGIGVGELFQLGIFF